ncbi:MAG: YfhO family protein [Clostridia bacterium]
MKTRKEKPIKIGTSCREILQRNKLILAAFCLPVILMLLAFLVMGIYPAGENQIAVIDMYHQYVPFLGELQSKLQSGGSLFYTWNGAGGSNFWNLLAYYGASPLNLILVLFPKKFLMEGVTLILLLKIGLAGSTMAVYLRAIVWEKDKRSADISLVGFATLYALCSYVMAYYWCIMWMDAVALLPLCILGLHKILDGRSGVFYTVCLALVVFINYYMAIMVCIFILFYYPVLYFIKVQGESAGHFFKTTGRAVGYSLLGVLMSAVMLLPTWMSMQSTYYISADMPEKTELYNDLLDILNQMLPNAELTYREGLPNLYCGMFVVILLVFYWISRTIPLREKLLNGAFLVFLIFSLNINKLDFIWHGFHFPNQLPYRYTFMICFLLIAMAYQVFQRVDEIRVNHLWILLAAGGGYYLLAQKILTEHIKDLDLFVCSGLAWLALYVAILLLYKKGRLPKNLLLILTVILLTCEMASNTCTSIDQVGTTQRSNYYANEADIAKLVKKTEGTDDRFGRTEMNDNYILNCPAMYHYKGISQFSSSLNANATALMEHIGVEGAPDKNRFNYNQTDPVTNAMLNIRYLIGKNLPIDDSDFKQIAKSGNSRLYESIYPLSIGYMTADTIRTWNYEQENPFMVLDDYVRAVTQNKYTSVFTEIEPVDVSAANIELSSTGDGMWDSTLKNETKKSKTILTYQAQQTGKQYLFIEADDADAITVSQEKKDDKIEIRNDCGSIVNLGEMDSGTEFTVTIEYKEGKGGSVVSHVCTMDEAVWQDAYKMLSASMLDVTDYGDSCLKGTIDVQEDGVFVTSVPYEAGWKLKVDGHTREINELIGGAWISTSLSAGEHQIELSFRPPGLIAGLLITLASIGLLIAAEWWRRRRMLRKLQSVLPAIFADMEAVGEAGLTESLDIPEHAEAYDISSASPLFDESSEEARDLH